MGGSCKRRGVPHVKPGENTTRIWKAFEKKKASQRAEIFEAFLSETGPHRAEPEPAVKRHSADGQRWVETAAIENGDNGQGQTRRRVQTLMTPCGRGCEKSPFTFNAEVRVGGEPAFKNRQGHQSYGKRRKDHKEVKKREERGKTQYSWSQGGAVTAK